MQDSCTDPALHAIYAGSAKLQKLCKNTALTSKIAKLNVKLADMEMDQRCPVDYMCTRGE